MCICVLAEVAMLLAAGLVNIYCAAHNSCGKTTQIPQLVLDAAIDAGCGADVNILVRL